MILKYDDVKKLTPKQMAQDIIYDALQNTGYWEENCLFNSDKMTERERELVNDQLEKVAKRIVKSMGYDPKSFLFG